MTVGFIDTTIRDCQQSLWSTRMTTDTMLPIMDGLDRAGFAVIDCMAQVQIDVMVRFLKENPWERLRLIRERVTRTPLRTWMRAKGYSFTSVMPQDLIDLWIERLVRNGHSNVVAFDGLNDFDNLAPIIRKTKALGATSVAALTYSISPYHTDRTYADLARRLCAETEVDGFVIKDSGGLLRPERLDTLVPAIKAEIGGLPLEIHTHNTTGLGALVLLQGVRLGAELIHTGIAPLANGVAAPSVANIADNLAHMNVDVPLDMARIAEISDYLNRLAEQEGRPKGQVREYDLYHFQHQAPGGMITNFRSSLADAGLEDKIDAVLEECIRVREELGWPMLITPFAQIIGTQALMNILRGERYAIVPDVLKRYVLGYFGKLSGPVDPEVMDRIVERGARDIPLEVREPEPIVDSLRRRFPDMSDDERLLRHMFVGSQVDDMLAAPPIREDFALGTPLLRLVEGLLKARRQGVVAVSNGRSKVMIRHD